MLVDGPTIDKRFCEPSPWWEEIAAAVPQMSRPLPNLKFDYIYKANSLIQGATGPKAIPSNQTSFSRVVKYEPFYARV